VHVRLVGLAVLAERDLVVDFMVVAVQIVEVFCDG
jgi:hypothetical protein